MVQMNNRRWLTVISQILFCVFILESCNRPISVNKLYGVYVSNEPQTKDSIFIYSNHVYLHKLVLENSVHVQKERWEYKNNEIAFTEFFFMDEIRLTHGTWISTVELADEKIRLIIASDLDQYYVKVK